MVVDGGSAGGCRRHGRDKRVARVLLEDGVTDLNELVDMPPSTLESCCGVFGL